MICYIVILFSVIFNLFVLNYDAILYPKCLPCNYVPPENGPLRPKHVWEIIMTKQIFMHEYLQ